MKTKLTILIQWACLAGLCLFLSTANLSAQPTEEWDAVSSSPSTFDDQSYALAVDDYGNSYVTGTAYRTSSFDIGVIKYNSAGTRQWTATYGGAGGGSDEGCDIAIYVDESSNIFIYVAGTVYSGAPNDYDYAILKYNDSGTLLWDRTVDGSGGGWDAAMALAVDEDGNVYVTGGAVGSSTGYDFLTICFDEDGYYQWSDQRDGGTSNYDFAYDIALDGSGNVYVTGGSNESSVYTPQDFLTVKYNSGGTEQWYARWDCGSHYTEVSMAMTVDANYVYLTGYGSNGGLSNLYDDFLTMKLYQSNGNVAWYAYWNYNSYSDRAKSIAVNGSGEVYVTGQGSESSTDSDIATIKYNSNGTLAWDEDYPTGTDYGNDVAHKLALDEDDNVYVTGQTASNGNGYNCETIKYESDGTLDWDIEYDGTDNDADVSYDIALYLNPDDDEYYIYITGYTSTTGSAEDWVTIQYSQSYDDALVNSGSNLPTDIDENFIKLPTSLDILDAYPNPFNPNTMITYALPAADHVVMEVYNAAGTKVADLVDGQQEAGWHSVQFDASGLSSGVYFVRMNCSEITRTYKVILTK